MVDCRWFGPDKTSDGQFRFALKASEKETLLASETDRSRDSAESGIASVRRNCASEARYEKKIATDGKFFFGKRPQPTVSAQMFCAQFQA